MRADVYLAQHGHAPSREQARRLIAGGCVTLDGRTLRKPAEEVTDGTHRVEVRDAMPYVGRGGLKLAAALDAFGLAVAGWTALDVGASTGGFTDCLLQRGAARVWAVDSGSGQLAPALRADPRVVLLERCNARYLGPEQLGGPVRLIVMDVSFISATCILPRFPLLLQSPGDAVCLVKPQFEVGRAMVGKGGIVRSPEAHRLALERVIAGARQAGLRPVGLIPSPVPGGDGNREFLLRLTLGQDALPECTGEQIRLVTGLHGRRTD